MGIPQELVDLIENMYKAPTFAVKEGSSRSQERKPCQTDFSKLFYADDTLILASNHQATELLLHKIQTES
eukprot:11692352-Heterocapsa_arctica.AAC.1